MELDWGEGGANASVLVGPWRPWTSTGARVVLTLACWWSLGVHAVPARVGVVNRDDADLRVVRPVVHEL